MTEPPRDAEIIGMPLCEGGGEEEEEEEEPPLKQSVSRPQRKLRPRVYTGVCSQRMMWSGGGGGTSAAEVDEGAELGSREDEVN